MWNNQVNIIVDPMFPLSVCWCNQGPKSPKGLRTQGGNYHQTLRSSLLLENCAMLSFLTLFISSFQSLCRDTLFRDHVHVGDFIDTLALEGDGLVGYLQFQSWSFDVLGKGFTEGRWQHKFSDPLQSILNFFRHGKGLGNRKFSRTFHTENKITTFTKLMLKMTNWCQAFPF